MSSRAKFLNSRSKMHVPFVSPDLSPRTPARNSGPILATGVKVLYFCARWALESAWSESLGILATLVATGSAT